MQIRGESGKDQRMSAASPATTGNKVASQLPSHGYTITRTVKGSDIPMELTFVLTRDEIYVPIAVRKPPGNGPFPAITMGRGNGRGGMKHVEAQVERLASLQDLIISRGYVV